MSQTSTLKGQCIAEFLGTGLLIFRCGLRCSTKSRWCVFWSVGNQCHLGTGGGNGYLPDRRGFRRAS